MQLNEVQQSEQQRRLYEAITGNTPDLIYVFDLQYRFIYANTALLNMWGKTWEAAIGRNLQENGYEPWHAEMHEREIDQVAATKQPIRGEVHFPHATQGKRYYDYIFVPVLNERGEVEAIAGTTRDITEIRNTTEQLQMAKEQVEQSEQNFRSMILQSPVAMCILLGPDHVVDIANDAMIELWGKPKEAVLQKPIFEGLPDARQQGLEKLLDDVYRTGVPFTATEWPVELVRHNKPEMVYQNFVYEPYRNGQGVIIGVMAISNNVTTQVLARKEIEELVDQRTSQLEASNEELRRSNENLEEFAHAASHDLKEPVRKIITFSERLEGKLEGRLSEEERQYFQRLKNAATRMNSLIDDLLSFSEVSRKGFQMEAVDLNATLKAVLRDLEVAVEEKGATLEVGKLPVVKGYGRLLEQLFQNLVGNALKYSKAEVKPVIRIDCQPLKGADAPTQHLKGAARQRDYYHISVADNGIGFAQENADRIFRMFQRLHGRAEYSGAGIGLAVVQKIVAAHEGCIWAESQPGEGATFHLLLPTDEAAVSQ